MPGGSALLRALLAALVLIFPHARASESMPPRAYEVTTETSMPHLEESLRYATTRERRCLTEHALSSAFPILSHTSLQGCRLEERSRQDDAVSYALNCAGAQGATGAARWHLGAEQITGLLEVKLGGKNMTLYQRITARPLGACTPDAK